MFPVPLGQLPYWHPSNVRDFALDRDLLDQLRAAMLAASPGPWYRLILEVRGVADVIKTRLATKIDRWGDEFSVAELDDDGIALVKAIRDDSYRSRPARGALARRPVRARQLAHDRRDVGLRDGPVVGLPRSPRTGRRRQGRHDSDPSRSQPPAPRPGHVPATTQPLTGPCRDVHE
jgi:hypothetical protein